LSGELTTESCNDFVLVHRTALARAKWLYKRNAICWAHYLLGALFAGCTTSWSVKSLSLDPLRTTAKYKLISVKIPLRSATRSNVQNSAGAHLTSAEGLSEDNERSDNNDIIDSAMIMI
jgi:cation transporter-like permease